MAGPCQVGHRSRRSWPLASPVSGSALDPNLKIGIQTTDEQSAAVELLEDADRSLIGANLGEFRTPPLRYAGNANNVEQSSGRR